MKYGRKLSLKTHRNIAGYTQDAFAEAVGVDRATVSQWETGAHHPHGKNVAKIEQVLEINWADDVLVPEV